MANGSGSSPEASPPGSPASHQVGSARKRPPKLDRITSEKEGTIFYPSGNIAVSAYITATGRVINFLEDSSKPKAGGYATRLVPVREKGQHSEIQRMASKRRSHHCGEDLRRSESYLDKVIGSLPGGPLQLDVQAIRKRQSEVGSLYIPRGPHHEVTLAPGIGILRTLVKGVAAGCESMGVIDAMDGAQRRAKLLTQANARQISSEALPDDFGAPTLSRVQKRFQKLTDGTDVTYTRRRLKIPAMAMKDVEVAVLGPDAPPDTLVALCLLASWSPVCFRLEGRLEEAYLELKSEVSGSAAAQASQIRVHKVDASEGCHLQRRFDFRTIPMFLMFYEGRLVYASNAIHTKEDFLMEVRDGLAKGRKAAFLPEQFQFHGRDNAVLDGITNEMSLLIGA